MKRFFSSIILIFLAATLISAQAIKFADKSAVKLADDDEEDGDYYEMPEYKANGAGDQFIKISLMGIFPLNFDDKLKTGGAAEIGYHRFVSEYFALGFDVQFGYNPTIGSNMLTYVPMVLTGTFQPYIGNFEFPLTLGIGCALESYLNRNYFPGLILKGEGGFFYRVSENWSFGVESQYMYMPQWYSKHSEWNDYGLFLSAGLVARYHF